MMCDIFDYLWEHRNSVLHQDSRSETQTLDKKVGRIYNELCMHLLKEKDAHIIKKLLFFLLQ